MTVALASDMFVQLFLLASYSRLIVYRTALPQCLKLHHVGLTALQLIASDQTDSTCGEGV